MEKKLSKKIVRERGLEYVRSELFNLGWNADQLPPDIQGDFLIKHKDSQMKYVIQVRALSKKNAVGVTEKGFKGNYLVIVRHVLSEKPEIFILDVEKANELIDPQKGKYWLEIVDYERFKNDLSFFNRI